MELATAGTASAQVPAIQFRLVSGDGQSGPVNTPLAQPLIVSITTPPAVLIEGNITWTVETGPATGTLGTPIESFTAFTGGPRQFSNTLTLGSVAGEVRVSALLRAQIVDIAGRPLMPVPPASVTFRATATQEPPPPPPQNGFQIAAEGLKSFSVMGNVAVQTTTVQTTNIGLRLASLRSGAKGISLEGLSLGAGEKAFPLGALASVAPVPGGRSSPGRDDLLSRLGIFANGQGSFGNQDATTREPGFDFHTAGMTAGVDYRLTEQLILGLAGGYISGASSLDGSAGEVTTRGGSISAFGTYFIGRSFYVDLIATYGWNDYDTRRTVGVGGASATAKGDTHGQQFAVSAGAGYDFNIRAWTLGLNGRVNYINVGIDDFRETGAGASDLNVSTQKVESLTTVLGAHVSYAISLPWAVLLPQVTAEWEHEYLNDSRLIKGTVVADPSQTRFGFPTNDPDRNYCNLGAGVSATFKHGLSAFLFYETVLGRTNFTAHSLTGGIRFSF
jgi:outer membrane autotransporter protein